MVSTNAPDALASALRDRYVLERELGRGGMATVYLARDLKHGREVAVKVLRPELVALLGPERFLAEVALAARLDHPHILTLIDSGEAAGTLYYVLPYIRGESLRRRLLRERQLPVEEAVRIAAQVAGALEYAHRQGVIHRDIKPENILIHEGEAMLVDFGVALAVREAADERMTESGILVGTPQYMSPEQASGDRNLTARSDLFSLGVVVYEMLTGEPPFTGPSSQAVFARVLSTPPPGIRAVRDTVPPAIEAAVLRCLEKLPADRFPSAEAFAVALRDGWISTPHPVGAPPAAPARAWRWAIGVAAVLAGIVLAWSARKSASSGESAALPGLPAVLVAPFLSGAGDTLAASVARALSQAIVDSLSNRRGLRAVAAAGDPARAADSLLQGEGIGLLLSGSVERQARELKVTARVSDAATRAQVYSHAQQALPEAAAVMQDDLVEQLVRFVRRYVGRETRRRAVAAGTSDAAARAYWARAMTIIDVLATPEAQSLPTSAMDRLAVADSLLGEAIRRDPRWTGPYVARGWAYLESADLHGSAGQRDSVRIAVHRQAIAAADAAIRIAPGDAAAHELRGVALVGLWLEVPSDQADSVGRVAELELRRAIALDLNVARAWEALSTYYVFVGRFGESRQAIIQALQADEFLLSEPGIVRLLVLVDLNLERYAEARDRCAQGARWYPQELGLVLCRLNVMGWGANDAASARDAWTLGQSIEADAPPVLRSDVHRTTLLWTAAILARAGDRDSAQSLVRAFERTRQGPEDLDGFAGDEAYVRLLLGQREEALALLKTFLHHNWSQRGYVQHTPWYRPLHEDPRFVAMTERRP